MVLPTSPPAPLSIGQILTEFGIVAGTQKLLSNDLFPLVGGAAGATCSLGASFSGQSQGLYSFTNATFTPGGVTGRYGPSISQARAGLTGTPAPSGWNTNTSFFNMTTQGIMLWTVPQTGSYTVRVVGASAGNDNEATATVGNPGDITGTFNFTQGNVIKILVGQRGWLGDPRPGWGGGGGSFVASSTDSPLIVAGGCGATHTGYSSITPCQNATTGTAGNVNSTGGSVTWTAGYGATGGQGGDGAGFYGNGTVGNGSGGGTAPSAFINGGLGAPRGGGFGGGAAVTNTYGGGGGGYSGGQGGGSGGSPNAFTGGGGGSYNSGTNQTNTLYGNGATSMVNGFVTITKN